MKNLIVLIDTNVILDDLIDREPFAENAHRILELCAETKVLGCIAGHSLPAIFYILRKSHSAAGRKAMLRDLCEILEPIGINKPEILAALNREDFDDLEDCLQAVCAKTVSADYIITRNTDDFANSPIPAILPEDFLTAIKPE
jgi:predicted nucleic acid-binding protein